MLTSTMFKLERAASGEENGAGRHGCCVDLQRSARRFERSASRNRDRCDHEQAVVGTYLAVIFNGMRGEETGAGEEAGIREVP